MNRLQHRLIDERQQWFLWVPVLYGIGIAGYFSLPKEPPFFISLLLPLLFISLIVIFRKHLFWRYFLGVFLIVALGFSASQWRTVWVDAPVLAKETRPVKVTGRIAAIEAQPHGNRVILESLEIGHNLLGGTTKTDFQQRQGVTPHLLRGLKQEMPQQVRHDNLWPSIEHTPKKIRLMVRTGMDGVETGDKVTLLAVLMSPPRPVYPGAYDFSRIAYFQQIGATGYAISPVTILEHAKEITLFYFVSQLRANMLRTILSGLGEGTGGVVAALSVGEQGAINKQIYQHIRTAGLAHLLSISGLHLALVVGVFFFLSRGLLSCSQTLALNYPIKKWAALLALLGSFFYLAMAGFPIPAIRSFIMAGLVLVAILLDRTPTPMRCVALAAIGILILEPESLLGPSFQMSFSAVVALIASYQWLAERNRRKVPENNDAGWIKKCLFYLLGIVFSSLVAGVATAPFGLYHFNNYSSYGILANLLAIPITSFWVMPWIVVFFLLYPFGLATLALIPIGWGVDAILYISREIALMPFAVDAVPTMPAASFALLVLGGCWLCFWKKDWRIYGLAPIALGVFLCLFSHSPDMIIDEEGKLFAVKEADGALLVSSKRQALFARKIWEQRLGKTSSEAIGRRESPSLACDVFGCNYQKNNKKVEIIQNPVALKEACLQGEGVVNLTYARVPCRSADLYISKAQLRRNGTHTVSFSGGEMQVRHVRALQGERPWVR